MAYSKQERLEIGRKVNEGKLKIKDIAKQLNVSLSCISIWKKSYRESVGLSSSKSKRAKVSDSSYKNMNNEQLKKELMRKDIEIERLKKGYVVRGCGGKKEFVSLNKLNIKS